MGTEKRARQKANREAKMAEQHAEEKTETREQNTRRFGVIAAGVALVIGLALLLSWCGGGDNDSSNEISFTPTPVPETESAAEVEVELLDSVPSDFVPFAGEGALAQVKPEARDGVYDELPAQTIDPERSYAVVMDTTAGTIRLELFADEAPVTVNNFVNLARDGFYDGVSFHRVMNEFMAQGGDPSGTGGGGPGYQFQDEFVDTRIFDSRGQLAMANAGPGTNGSQFFITFVPTPHLNGLHTIFGQLVGDDAILDEITISGQGEPTIINSVRIIEG